MQKYETIEADGELDIDGLADLLACMYLNYQDRMHAKNKAVNNEEPMTLAQLADKYQVRKSVDISSFQRKARIMQSIWREENNYPCGIGSDGKYLGSRLPEEEAKETLNNYLTERIRTVVRHEVDSPESESDKLFAKPRIYNDLLSSQPLCFNLFGELTYNLALATAIVQEMSMGRFCKVTKIQFEMSPGRGDNRFLGDRSAFDVLLECETATGGRGFIGIEVKYHENLIGKPGRHRVRYDEVANEMKCFPADHSVFMVSPLQQLWRDHLLSGILKIKNNYEDALFIVLYPKDNGHVAEAVKGYRADLIQTESFDAWTLEEFVVMLKKYSDANWIDLFYNRYLAFDKVETLLF